MRHRLRARPRLAAAAVLSLAGGLLAAAAPPARADCLGYKLAFYENKSGWEYIGENDPDGNCITDTGWNQTANPGHYEGGTDVWFLPPGAPAGVGIELFLPAP